ncbi:MAG: hypothetical protein ISQ32_04045, partial [Rickettsiales bacterium]|nr:hypothetical protein [Rickettsiales bacterium]
PEFLIYKTSSFLDDIKQNSDEQDLYNQIFKNAGAESNSHSHYFRTFTNEIKQNLDLYLNFLDHHYPAEKTPDVIFKYSPYSHGISNSSSLGG